MVMRGPDRLELGAQIRAGRDSSVAARGQVDAMQRGANKRRDVIAESCKMVARSKAFFTGLA